MIDETMLEAEEKMEKAVEVAKEHLAGIRTGRVNPGLFSKVTVDYYGAPTPITAFMAAATKIAAFGALLRVFYVAFDSMRWTWQPVIEVVALLTMVVGAVNAGGVLPAHWIASIVAALTTVAGFAGLLVAHHPGLRNIGEVGVMAVLVVVFLALSPVLITASLVSFDAFGVALATIGLVLYASSMWVSGIMEGLMWREVDSQGFLVNAFADTVIAKYPMLVVRTLGGVFYLAGGIIMAWNLWATVARQPRIAPARVAVPAE